ncbi:hypothetical protein EZV62_027164 [Acer yangbiense]|uniref:Uncharacterized protein n=1 Tax=Acer yangbiense TaxID=1000413 RepID=A0A5C7GTI1_9ROSI|nr:hypothetical protein EZV62_027164 [Acer yangbiense]
MISSAPWIKIPYPLQWGAPTFDAGHASGMMAAVMSTGAYKAASRPRNRDSTEWTLWNIDRLYSLCRNNRENVGLLGSTRVGSRRVIQISAGFMIFFSMLGKFGAIFASIPFTIFAAVYCVLFGLVSSVGLSFLQFTNMNSMRNLFICGVALFLGLSIPEYFRQYTATALSLKASKCTMNDDCIMVVFYYSVTCLIDLCFFCGHHQFNDFLNTIFFSSPTVALIVAVF